MQVLIPMMDNLLSLFEKIELEKMNKTDGLIVQKLFCSAVRVKVDCFILNNIIIDELCSILLKNGVKNIPKIPNDDIIQVCNKLFYEDKITQEFYIEIKKNVNVYFATLGMSEKGLIDIHRILEIVQGKYDFMYENILSIDKSNMLIKVHKIENSIKSRMDCSKVDFEMLKELKLLRYFIIGI